MILRIDTTQNNFIEIGIKNQSKLVVEKKIKSDRTQAEKLLPAIEKLLKDNKIKISGVKEIEVKNKAGSFTSLRIGVVTANALGYALNIPVKGENKTKVIKSHGSKFSIVEPLYNGEPKITAKKDCK